MTGTIPPTTLKSQNMEKGREEFENKYLIISSQDKPSMELAKHKPQLLQSADTQEGWSEKSRLLGIEDRIWKLETENIRRGQLRAEDKLI